ncbi:MAG TPA: DNA translocase FtsK 4TM domain-containing protein, partial [Cyclobacteriaceae bacterium]|nr:DNA translocase FtsK 4TM domain-containing protein [Cyclobacteriaceae bacterium]
MAKNTYKSNNFKQGNKKANEKDGSRFSLAFFKDPRFHLALGFFLLITCLYMFTAFVSYLFTGKADHSVVEAWQEISILESGKEAENWLGLYGAIMSHFFIFRWFGIAAFFIPPFLFLLGFRLVFKRTLVQLLSAFTFVVFALIWVSLLMGSVTLEAEGVNEWSFLSGGMGYSLALVMDGMLGWGTYMLLILTLFIFIIYFFNVTAIRAFQVNDPKPMGSAALD